MHDGMVPMGDCSDCNVLTFSYIYIYIWVHVFLFFLEMVVDIIGGKIQK